MSQLTRTLQVGCVGKDVEGCKRAVYRYLHQGGQWNTFTRSAPLVRQTFGVFFRTSVKSAQARLGLPQTGAIGPRTFEALQEARAFDMLADAMLDQYAVAHKPLPVLIEPRQGFMSLHKSLWEAFSIGRRMGLSDLGTHNAASTLPGGGPSDHSVWPAYAFDLGVDPDNGWDNTAGRAFCLKIVGRPEIEYVILGSRIWTNDGRGWHTYSSGNHANHVHVSGKR